jgi:hypothetical protein
VAVREPACGARLVLGRAHARHQTVDLAEVARGACRTGRALVLERHAERLGARLAHVLPASRLDQHRGVSEQQLLEHQAIAVLARGGDRVAIETLRLLGELARLGHRRTRPERTHLAEPVTGAVVGLGRGARELFRPVVVRERQQGARERVGRHPLHLVLETGCEAPRLLRGRERGLEIAARAVPCGFVAQQARPDRRSRRFGERLAHHALEVLEPPRAQVAGGEALLALRALPGAARQLQRALEVGDRPRVPAPGRERPAGGRMQRPGLIGRFAIGERRRRFGEPVVVSEREGRPRGLEGLARIAGTREVAEAIRRREPGLSRRGPVKGPQRVGLEPLQDAGAERRCEHHLAIVAALGESRGDQALECGGVGARLERCHLRGRHPVPVDRERTGRRMRRLAERRVGLEQRGLEARRGRHRREPRRIDHEPGVALAQRPRLGRRTQQLHRQAGMARGTRPEERLEHIGRRLVEARGGEPLDRVLVQRLE